MHSHECTHIHEHRIHTYIAYIQHIRTYIHAHTYNIQKQVHTHNIQYIHMHTQIGMHTDAYTHTHTHTHTCMHTYTKCAPIWVHIRVHTLLHTHAYTQMHTRFRVSIPPASPHFTVAAWPFLLALLLPEVSVSVSPRLRQPLTPSACILSS